MCQARHDVPRQKYSGDSRRMTFLRLGCYEARSSRLFLNEMTRHCITLQSRMRCPNVEIFLTIRLFPHMRDGVLISRQRRNVRDTQLTRSAAITRASVVHSWFNGITYQFRLDLLSELTKIISPFFVLTVSGYLYKSTETFFCTIQIRKIMRMMSCCLNNVCMR